MVDTDTKQMRTGKSDPRAAMYINKMFVDVGQPDMNSADDDGGRNCKPLAKQIDPNSQGKFCTHTTSAMLSKVTESLKKDVLAATIKQKNKVEG